MKRFLKPLFVAALFCSLVPSNLFAMGGQVTSPVISVPKPPRPGEAKRMNFVTAQQNRTLLFKDFEKAFISGYFINSLTWLYFDGDAATLNRMLNELHSAEGVEFGVRFSSKAIDVASPFDGRPGSSAKGKAATAQWRINHDGASGSVWITIYTGAGGIDLEKLEIPAMKGLGTENQVGGELRDELRR